MQNSMNNLKTKAGESTSKIKTKASGAKAKAGTKVKSGLSNAKTKIQDSMNNLKTKATESTSKIKTKASGAKVKTGTKVESSYYQELIDQMNESKADLQQIHKEINQLTDELEKIQVNNFESFNESASTTAGTANAKSSISFSQDRTEAIKQMSKHYGDAGSNINDMLLQQNSIDEILSKLNGKEKIEFQKFLANTREGQYISNLSNEEIRAMTTYTSGEYRKINEMLRNKHISGSINNVDSRTLINNIDSAIKKYGGLEESTRLYRAVNTSAFTLQKSSYRRLFKGIDVKDLNQVYSVLKVLEGKKFGDLGYMSTSPGYSTSFAKYQEFPIILDIAAEEGASGAYINQISKYYNNENEFLLSRDTKLQMVEVMPPAKDINGLEKIVIKCVIK